MEKRDYFDITNEEVERALALFFLDVIESAKIKFDQVEPSPRVNLTRLILGQLSLLDIRSSGYRINHEIASTDLDTTQLKIARSTLWRSPALAWEEMNGTNEEEYFFSCIDSVIEGFLIDLIEFRGFSVEDTQALTRNFFRVRCNY